MITTIFDLTVLWEIFLPKNSLNLNWLPKKLYLKVSDKKESDSTNEVLIH